MIPYESDRGKVSFKDDNKAALLEHPDGHNGDTGPKFQPGDHIIRWKLLKVMVWPIQVHGIVLGVKNNQHESNPGSSTNLEQQKRDDIEDYTYTIADFGYTSSQTMDDEQNNDPKNKLLKNFGNLNQKMKSLYKSSKNMSASAPMDKTSCLDSLIPRENNNKNKENMVTGKSNFDDDTFEMETEMSRGKKRFQVLEITNSRDLKKWHKIDYGKSLLPKTKFKEKMAKSSRNLMEKLKLRKKKSEKYSSIAMDQDSAGTSALPPSVNDDSPKLPKSDPRKIVLARTRYILDQQELPESEQTLPPYHILYSNSECLAVWCKTGKFSTLQAAIFLHSTAVGNAKGTFLMTGAVVATQPWLIPVVGIYGAVAIGMPYLILKKCKEKWKTSEQNLTDGFWSTADSEVFVAAIENWSSIDPSKKE